MAIEQKRSVGSESSITSIALENIRESSLNENHETTADVSGVPLKVRKPYTISKQREKWTEDEHQRFIEAIKLYGRGWRQIEEYIGTKSAVQIRSHAQKFFSKVMKEGPCSAEASIEPIEIPPPRPKRKPLHPYPRKQPLALVEDGISGNMKISDREVHSPISVLSPEGSQISALLANKGQGSGCGSRTSSDSNVSHVVENNTLIKDSSTTETKNENEDLSLTLHFSSTSPDDSTLMSAGKTLMMDIESPTDEDDYADNRIKCVEGVAPVKIIKLFGHTVAVPEKSEYSDSRNNQLTPNNILMGKMTTEKVSSKSFSCTGSNSETNLESVDSKMESNQQANANSDKFKKGFYPYKRCLSDQEAVYTLDARERQRIRVYL